MGTWDTGVLDNDSALDFIDMNIFSSSPEDCLKNLTEVIENLATCNPEESADIHSDVQSGVGACAVVADKLHGSYFYLYEPEEKDDLTLDMVPQIDEALKNLAIKAVKRAIELTRHDDMPEWNTKEDEDEHLANLRRLAERLSAPVKLSS